MDKARLSKQNLTQAKRHVAKGQRNVERQREVVAALARDSHPTETAMALLHVFEQALELHRQDRDRLSAELAALRQPSSRRRNSGWSRDTQR